MEYNAHPQWSGLPQDLLSNIAKRFESRIHLLCFRAVCSTWRSSTPLPLSNSSSSLKLPFPIEANPSSNLQQQAHFTLTHSTIHSLQPLTKITNSWNTTKTWIVRVEEDSSRPGKVRLRDPLSTTFWDHYPKGCPKSLNMLDYRVTEIAQAYELNVAGIAATPRPKKVIGANLNGCFAVMTIMSLRSNLAVWKLGDEKWTVIDDVCDNDIGVDVRSLPLHLQSQGYYKGRFIDIAYHNGKFYAVEFKGRGRTVSIDSSLKMTEVVPRSPDQFPNGDHLLVESSGDLFLILQYMRDLEEYDELCDDDDEYYGVCDEKDLPYCKSNVYRMNEENQWVLQHKLGDKVFFLGRDCNFCVSAHDFPGCRPSCMYSVSYDDIGDEDDDEFGLHPGYDVGIFDFENDAFEKPCQTDCKLFWPPPTWLKPNPPSRRC